MLLIAAFVSLSGAPVLAVASTGTELKTGDSYSKGELESYELQDNIIGYDEDLGLKCSAPPALSEVEGLAFDPEFVSSTPYWIYIAAGKTEQQALIDYIEKSDISKDKKKEWREFLQVVWKKYPLNYVKKDSAATISTADQAKGCSLTKSETETFEEIDKMIFKDMQEVAEGQVSPKWGGNVHRGFMEVALETEDYLNNESLNNSAINSADDPDDWYSNDLAGVILHCINHGALFGSAIGGLAAENTGSYANNASDYYEQHNYEEAFINLGYSSHFMADLGQPYHTPGLGMELIWPNYDDPLSSDPKILRYHILHDKYEIFLGTFWEQAVPGGMSFKDYAASTTDAVYIIDPILSADRHGTTSYLLSTPLYYLCEWHFITNNDYNFEDSPLIVAISRQRVIATTENIRGLIRYVTGEEAPTLTISASGGENGSISPAGDVSVIYGESQTFTIAPDSGYVIDELLVDGAAVEASTEYTFSDVTGDHTISATFIPAILPLCPAGTPFDSSVYPQNQPESDPMTFECNWDGNGRVYISGEPSELTGVWADDGFTITIQPSGQTFDATPHRACQHNILELTGGMTQGTNTFTLVVKNWCRLSMSYGSFTGAGIDQTPYIIQVNSEELLTKAGDSQPEELPSFIKQTDEGLVVNGTLV